MKSLMTLRIVLHVILFNLVIGANCLAQICQANITLSTQAEVDAFHCVEVVGNINISGNDIENLDALKTLRYVNGSFSIEGNVRLTNLNGLSSLDSLSGGLYIRNNTLLDDITGLSSLKTVGDLILDNTRVRTLNVFESLTRINGSYYIANNQNLSEILGYSPIEFIGGNLHITSNINLNYIREFDARTVVGDIVISNNQYLYTIYGFATQTARTVTVNNNINLNTIQAFNNLTKTAEISIDSNNALTTLDMCRTMSKLSGKLTISNNASLNFVDGFKSLTEIDGDSLSSDAGVTVSRSALTNIDWLKKLKILTAAANKGAYITIKDNPNLTDINGLSNLSRIKGYPSVLEIINNQSLKNIDGLGSISKTDLAEPIRIRIQKNSVLERCNGLKNYFDSIGKENVLQQSKDGTICISENGSGCTVNEILDSEAIGPFCREDIVLSTQADVNAFNCQVIDGNLTISGTDINSLAPLNQLKVVTGKVLIYGNPNLLDISGLEALDSIGQSLTIDGNEQLTSLKGLRALRTVDRLGISGNLVLTEIDMPALNTSAGISIIGNQGLTQINGFNNLKTVGPLEIISNSGLTAISGFQTLRTMKTNTFRVPAAVTIQNNPYLATLTAFPSLTRVGDLTISENGHLLTIDGFNSLQFVSGIMTIQNNQRLRSLDGFKNLIMISTVSRAVTRSGLVIANNASLETLGGFSRLKTVGYQYNSHISIANNPSLKNLDGLDSLTSILGEQGTASLEVSGNATLENINGLAHLETINGYRGISLVITHNPMLTSGCAIRPLLKYVLVDLSSIESVHIAENGGCTLDEVINCGPQEITKLQLIDMRSGNFIGSIKDSIDIDISAPYFPTLSIQAATFPPKVGSVQFTMNHKLKLTDNDRPYLLPLADKVVPKKYKLSANVYSEPDKQGAKGIGKSVYVNIVNLSKVASFYTADTVGNYFSELYDSSVIILDGNTSIGAHAISDQISSVRFWLNNRLVHIDNTPPYIIPESALGYTGIERSEVFTLKAIPYVKALGREYPGIPGEIHFRLERRNIAIVVGFEVVDSHGRFIQALNEGDVIDVDMLRRLQATVVAKTNGPIKSVKFELNNVLFQVENFPPYTLTGDDRQNHFNPWNPIPSHYTLKATPYSEPQAAGPVGTELTINFSVVDDDNCYASRSAPGLNREGSRSAENALVAYPVPSETELFLKTNFDTPSAAHVSIITVQGKRVYSAPYRQQMKIDISMLEPGIYYINLNNNDGVYHWAKFVKK